MNILVFDKNRFKCQIQRVGSEHKKVCVQKSVQTEKWAVSNINQNASFTLLLFSTHNYCDFTTKLYFKSVYIFSSNC